MGALEHYSAMVEELNRERPHVPLDLTWDDAVNLGHILNNRIDECQAEIEEDERLGVSSSYWRKELAIALDLRRRV